MIKEKTKKTNTATKHGVVNVKLIAVSAMFAALVTVTTAFIMIPSPFGYAHAGDSMIYLAASILPPPFAIAASSIGAALADIITGYAYWAVPTAIIKALNTLPFIICMYYLRKTGKGDRIISIPNLLMLIPTTAVTVGGYFIAEMLIFGLESAVGNLTMWWLQPGVGALIFIALGVGLDSIKFKTNILPAITR